MMTRSLFLVLIFCICMFQNIFAQTDWKAFANFEKYADANAALSVPGPDEVRVVLMGNSITEAWPALSPGFFQENSNFIGRGISGQTTPQMVLRFRSDVIDLNPDIVVILAGTNDIAGNTGSASNVSIIENIKSMTEMARQNDIRVILCSILPAIDFPWRSGQSPAQRIVEVNQLIRAYAMENGLEYVDYYSALVDEEGGLKVPDYTSSDDLVHPNAAGYAVMEDVVMKVLKRYL